VTSVSIKEAMKDTELGPTTFQPTAC